MATMAVWVKSIYFFKFRQFILFVSNEIYLKDSQLLNFCFV